MDHLFRWEIVLDYFHFKLDGLSPEMHISNCVSLSNWPKIELSYLVNTLAEKCTFANSQVPFHRIVKGLSTFLTTANTCEL